MRFEFRFDPVYARLGRVFGITPANSWVELDDTTLRARYGRWRVTTPLSNVAPFIGGKFELVT